MMFSSSSSGRPPAVLHFRVRISSLNSLRYFFGGISAYSVPRRCIGVLALCRLSLRAIPAFSAPRCCIGALRVSAVRVFVWYHRRDGRERRGAIDNRRFQIADFRSKISDLVVSSDFESHSLICNLKSAICNLRSAICNLKSAI